MKLSELFFEAAINSWDKAIEDAKSKGISIQKGPAYNKKAWVLSSEGDYDQFRKDAIEAGVIPYRTSITNPFIQYIYKISEYPKAIKEIQLAKNNKQQYIQSLLDKQYEIGYNWLHDKLEQSSKGFHKPSQYQLFMPRPQVLTKKTAGWVYDYDNNGEPLSKNESIKLKEARPILTGRVNSPPGRNKPSHAFWTANLKEAEKGYYTSDWVKWVLGNQSDWFNPVGYVYRVKPNARILPFGDTSDAQDIYIHYAMMGAKVDYNNMDIGDGYYSSMNKDFPWTEIAKNWDGVYHPYNGRSYDGDTPFQYGWDIPSTAWLNTDVLEFVTEVKISKQNDSDY